MGRLFSHVFFVILALTGEAHAATPAYDVTGVYGVRPDCRGALNIDAYEYVKQCFTGERFVETDDMTLVQNGHRICGYITECAGRNCNRDDGGRVVGIALPTKIRLFIENGHTPDGLATVREYSVGKGGLRELPHHSRSRLFERRKSVLKDEAVRKLCAPTATRALKIASGELQVGGMLQQRGGDLFTQALEEPLQKGPPRRTLRLSAHKDTAHWRDVRSNDNQVLRQLVVDNDTPAEWTVSASHSEICTHVLRGTPSGDAAEHVVEVPKQSKMILQSCKGSAWKVVKSPPISCLGGPC